MSEITNPLPALSPRRWATCPEWMTFSFIGDAEQCPRRASLRRSEYKDIWSGYGYPPGFASSAARGTILHASFRRIANELAQEGCTGINDPRAFVVLKRIGGFSAVLGTEIKEWMRHCEANPRLKREQISIQQRLDRMIPEMRLALQRLLVGTSLEADGERRARGGPNPGELKVGCHFEVELRHPTLHWKGIADLIEITGSGTVTIVDFKTGTPKDLDSEQLKIYALLWARDGTRNPSGHVVDQLTLQYPDKTLRVSPPTPTELVELENKLQQKSSSVCDQFRAKPPVANVAIDNCRFCDVRHLCSDYWKPGALHPGNLQNTPAVDCELLLTEKVGFSTWNAMVLHATVAEFPKELVVHFSDSSLAEVLHVGDRLRVLQTSVDNGDSGLKIITVRPTTETFKVVLDNGRQMQEVASD